MRISGPFVVINGNEHYAGYAEIIIEDYNTLVFRVCNAITRRLDVKSHDVNYN